MGRKIIGPTVGVEEALTDRALRALLKHHEATSSKDQLLGDELDVQVQFGLARIPRGSPKPIRIEIPHSLVKVDGDGQEGGNEDYIREVDACIIVKEESKPWVQELIARFPSELGCIKKVLGLQSLRTKHKSFTQRRELLARFDVFFADDRILPMLTKALGGKFFEKKKQPIPVKLTRKEALPFMIQKCLKSTFMYLSAGTCITVKAGNTAMPSSKLLDNIVAVCAEVPTKVPRKWANVGSISIKTSSSVSLPIYKKTPQELEQIRILAEEQVKADDRVEVAEASENVGGEKRKKKETPLAKALKKQKVSNTEKSEEKSAKKSKKKKKTKEEGQTDEEAPTNNTETVPKPRKKQENAEAQKVVAENESQESKAEVKSKKSKKKARKESVGDEDSAFIKARKFSGAKPGYVFKKGSAGLGYYRDVLPVVDKAWLTSLNGGRGGGRKSMGSSRRKKGGRSRKY
ncbi:hypothetical protein THAOC_12993 [Thalassiosira oceanica]|uniref:Ribosomal protein L1 n=1 Tax=Thalassiosira oceanica TaxID=159749 RepID=K0SMB6_THAOC|nr:hypothetical protein THAOC_12993 [Thalassiosira oceanica]|eukprot:EJK66104.1 hypothetical protein THAOC_12993 [Thalassiosira oceanica]